MNKSNLVIGGGIFGLNIALELVEKGEKVVLYTDTFDSVSYNYPIGAHINKVETDDLNLSIFKFKYIKINWLINYLLNYNHDEYKKQKLYCLKYGEALFKRRYNLSIYNRISNGDYILDSKSIINFIMNKLRKSPLFSYKIKSINVYNQIEMNFLQLKFEKIYVAIGGKCNSHKYIHKIGGYKYIIESKKKINDIINRNLFFLNDSDYFKKKQEEKHDVKNTIIVRGGYIFGNNEYNTEIYNENHKTNERMNEKINRFIKKNDFWNEFECQKMKQMWIGQRSVSVDNIPYYYWVDNICYIEGGSFVGFVTAPVLAHTLIHNTNCAINFHISRIQYNTYIFKIIGYSILFILIFILLYYYF
jgi:hypothetical protein